MNALILTALLIGQVPQAPRPPQAPPVTKYLDYTAGCKLAVQQDNPLITFVGCPVRNVPSYGPIPCGTSTLPGYTAPCIVVSLPDGAGWLQWRATLPATASDAEIRAALAPRKAVMAEPRPFSPPQR